MSNQAGKGDTPRKVDKRIYDANFDQIKWEKREKDQSSAKKVKNKKRYSY